MTITKLDRYKLILKIYAVLPKMEFRTAVRTLLKPAETTRYWEFQYLLKELERLNFPADSKILDISSPYVMSYLLTKYGYVLKTDINEVEAGTIKKSEHLSFKKEDGTKLSFNDNTFDLTYSISVIEHIYNGYITALKEMYRVTKPGGYIYISFPVSKEYKEEWKSEDIYSDQFKNQNRTFFQYRFDEEKTNSIFDSIKDLKLISRHIYWEKRDGLYDDLTTKLSKLDGRNKLAFLKNAFHNFVSGMNILDNEPAAFRFARTFGNVSAMFKKES